MSDEDEETGRHGEEDESVDDVLALELDRLAVDDALQLACGDERPGGGECAEHDFKAEGAAGDSDAFRSPCTRNSPTPTRAAASAPNAWESAVRWGMAVIGNPDGHPRADDRSDGKAGDDPDPGDDVRADEGADDGGEHAAFGQEHAAARSLGMRHALERKDEEDGSDQVGGFHEVGGQGHLATPASAGFASLRLLNILSMRSVMPNPPTTLMVAVVTATNPRMCAKVG